LEYFVQTIHNWFEKNQRELPWRLTKDPYSIWVSEIILQQTRVNQGIPYYNRFMVEFPDVTTLANAPEDQLMKIWEGLGYYSRARNMHEAAKTIADHYNGIFPVNYEAVRNLKGIGDYTAAAIVSIAFRLPYPVVDGNVFRFLSRYLGISESMDSSSGRKHMVEIASGLLDKDNPGFHNQALMEFGAVCCLPSGQDCFNCPVQDGCFAFQHKLTGKLPVRKKKGKKRVRYFYFCIPEDDRSIIIEKRLTADIWKNLYQPPLFESARPLTEQGILTNPLIIDMTKNPGPIKVEISQEHVHQLTHQEIRARFVTITLPRISGENYTGKVVKKEEIHTFAFPVLIRNFLYKKYSVV
jgi:A/G-specific adenine glycosylase